MALVDIYVLDLKQFFGLEECHNIFSYERLGDGTAVDLNNAFIEDVLPAINEVQGDVVTNSSLRTYSLGNLGDFTETALDGGGAGVAAQCLPSFAAYGFTLKPTTRAIRPGSKRFTGVPEASQNNGTIVDSATLANLELLRVALDTEISDDDVNLWANVIVKRVKYVPDPDRPDHFAYRYPETDAELVSSHLGGVLLSVQVTHQTSRKG